MECPYTSVKQQVGFVASFGKQQVRLSPQGIPPGWHSQRQVSGLKTVPFRHRTHVPFDGHRKVPPLGG